MTANPTQKRRWFRFSLRTLLIVVMLLSVPLGWFALKMRRAERQRQVVEAIRGAGGEVFYDYESDVDGVAAPPVPAWVGRLVGDDFSASVVFIRIRDCSEMDDTLLKRIGELKKLEYLDVSETEITDAGMQHLSELTRLRGLDLTGTEITDVGLQDVKRLTELEWLSLLGTEVTDEGIQSLSGLTRLDWLNLHGTKVTDDGLLHLNGLTRLEYLSLHGTKVTDDGLQNLKGLSSLEELSLFYSNVTEEGVKEFRRTHPDCDVLWVEL